MFDEVLGKVNAAVQNAVAKDKKEEISGLIARVVERMDELEGSDIYLQVNQKPAIRNKIGDVIVMNDMPVLSELDTQTALEVLASDSIYTKQMARVLQSNEIDFIAEVGGKRFRANACKLFSGSGVGIYMRYIPDRIPEFDTLGLPTYVKDLFTKSSGLILICGPTGSGKTTTLASAINEINHTQRKHIITIEDPIEFVIKSDKSFITQRQLEVDTKSFVNALKAALRQDPDVIMLGEMRDKQTMSAALQAVNTGHLVLSTLHTYSSKQTIERILNVFSGDERMEIKMALAFSLLAVIIQRLVPRKDGLGKVLVYEILLSHKSLENAIISDKVAQIENIIYQNASNGMVLLNQTLKDYVARDIISEETALNVSYNPKELVDWMASGGRRR